MKKRRKNIAQNIRHFVVGVIKSKSRIRLICWICILFWLQLGRDSARQGRGYLKPHCVAHGAAESRKIFPPHQRSENDEVPKVVISKEHKKGTQKRNTDL